MKKKLLLGSTMLALTLTSSAQITINRSDLGNIIYERIITAYDDTLNLLSPGSAGANQTWNLTGIRNDHRDTTQFIRPTGSAYLNNYPTATFAQQGKREITYYYDNSSVLEVLGFCEIDTPPETLVIPYTPPAIQMTFPSTYNTSFSGQTKNIIKLSFNDFPPVDSMKDVYTTSYTSLIDGWGNVTTPSGTYPSLRQKLIRYSIDSLFIHAPIVGWQFDTDEGASYDTTIEYNWWSQNNPFIASISTDFNGHVTDASYLLSSTLRVNEITENSNTVKVFPNPSNGYFTVAANNGQLAVSKIEIYNVLGETIFTSAIQEQQTSMGIDLSAYPKGIYFVKIYNGDKFHTEKVQIQ